VAQFGDDTVLITAQRGLIAYDRATGAVKWRRGLEELISSRFDAGSDRDAAVGLATVVGDADGKWLVLDGRLGVEQKATRWISAVDLTTGLVRGFGGGSAVGYDGGQVLTSSFWWSGPRRTRSGWWRWVNAVRARPGAGSRRRTPPPARRRRAAG